jgi:tetratricopeptide (TPR) repeat protein
VLRDRGVGVVVVSDREPQRLFAVLHRLAGDPEHWTLLDVAGEALIFGWNKARAGTPGGFTPLAFDAERLALGPPDERAESRLPPAPEQGPGHLPARPTLWARLARSPAPVPWESPAAAVYLHDFDDSQDQQARRQLRASMSGYAASLAGLAARPQAAPGAALQVVASHQVLFARDGDRSFLVREQLGPYFAPLGRRSPALPLLAVRAARRAVAANPEDANAWLRLGQAYVLLRDETCERATQGEWSPLSQLRQVQIATALEQAVRLDPDLEAAHDELAHLYGERNFLDQALAHLQEELRLSRRAGARPGETAEDFSYRLGLLERDFEKLDKLVRERRRDYASASRPLGGERLKQADLALKMGLVRQAVDDILLPCPADLLGALGIRRELELLLALGRAEDVRVILSDPAFARNKQVLGYYNLPAPNRADGTAFYPMPYHWPAYEWLQSLEAAALGDYAQAGEDLGAIRSGVRAGQERLRQQLREGLRPEWALLPWLLSGPSPFLPALAARDMGRMGDERAQLEAAEPVLLGHQADLDVLQGLLALERGDTEEARSAFAAAQQLGVPFAGAPIAGAYLGKLNVTEWTAGP